MALKISKPASKKKSSKGSTSSSSTEPILRETTQLFSLDLMDYDESIRVMIKLINHHPIAIPLSKILNPNFPLRLLHKAFERVKFEDGVLEVMIKDDRIVPMHKATFLRAIDVVENPKGFQAQ